MKKRAVTKTGDEGWRSTDISLQEQNTLDFKLLRTGWEVKNTECREGESVLTFAFWKIRERAMFKSSVVSLGQLLEVIGKQLPSCVFVNCTQCLLYCLLCLFPEKHWSCQQNSQECSQSDPHLHCLERDDYDLSKFFQEEIFIFSEK